MRTVYDTILACRATGSKNDKLAILKAQSQNLDLKEFLRVTYEPRINFYMKKIEDKKFGRGLSFVPQMNLNLVALIQDNLNGRVMTGHEAKTWIASLYQCFEHDWERELLTMLIERDVRAGFSESTTNKVWPGLVTDVPYMRCSLPKDAKLNKFNWPLGVFSQIKADGMFANINHNDDGSVTIMSRNGSPFPSDHPAFANLVADAKASIPTGMQTHGELLMFLDNKMLPRQDGNGKFNTLLQGGELDGNFAVAYEAWDLIPISEATSKNKLKSQYVHRFHALSEYLDAAGDRTGLWLIETRIVHSLKEAYEHYRDALDRGLEGTIIKDPIELIWEDSTSKWQVKMKLEFECDLEVVGYEEGKGKNAGMMGALLCQTSDGKLKVRVGSGFSDDVRKDIWARKDLKVIAAKSNSIMPPTRKDTYSLFLPIFVEERLDKKEADSLQRVIDQYEATIASVGS